MCVRIPAPERPGGAGEGAGGHLRDSLLGWVSMKVPFTRFEILAGQLAVGVAAGFLFFALL